MIAFNVPHHCYNTKIGEGAYSTVYSSLDNTAIKIFKKTHDDFGIEPLVLREISNMMTLNNCKYTLQIKDIYFGETCGFSMEKFGIELAKMILIKKTFSEESIKHIIYQLVSALVEAQQHLILHRDVKPQNILIDENLNIKLIDWGLSVPIYSEDIRTEDRSVQTLSYRCPEHLLKHFEQYNNETIDMWSVGVLMVELFCGATGIFYESSRTSTLLKIVNILGMPENKNIAFLLGKVCGVGIIKSSKSLMYGNFFEKIQKKYNVSDVCMSFIKQCLEWDPHNRLNPISALHHDFLKSEIIQHTPFEKLNNLISCNTFITNINEHIIKRNTYINKYLNFANHYKITIDDFALIMSYTDKLIVDQIQNQELKGFTQNTIVCAIVYIILMLTSESVISVKLCKRILNDSNLTISEIRTCVVSIVHMFKFPLCYKTFVTYKCTLLCFNKSVMQIFEKIAWYIVICGKYINYKPDQIFGSILHHIGNYKLETFYLKDKIHELLQIYPKHFDFEITDG